MFSHIVTFVKEARIELKKVTWPTRDETIRYTIMVVVVSSVMAIVLGGFDVLFQELLRIFVFS
ncbi:MAG: preprotein translocase subunit SecE [Parcubacteria group bacterium Gr01-1014_66]|nr:MAG: preprotein translocase subunit SecE [Parcubacteria group bacterium Gr01-1014_66]